MSDYPTFPPPSSPPPRRDDEMAAAHHDTTRLDPAQHEPTQRLPLYSSAGAPPAVLPPRRGRRGFAAAVVAASLLVGGAAGVGGAATYSALSDDEDGNSGAGPVRTSQVAESDDEPAPDGSVEQVASTVLPSVVKLDVRGPEGEGSGSGVVLSSDGLILTNEHVAGVAGEGGDITVSFTDGSKVAATLLGADPLTDTALVQAEDVEGLTPITIGESSKVDVGEQVVAIGSPFGLDATVTSGIVSALDRPVDVGSDEQGNSTVYPAIQTDAAINPGNSGGPLVDMEGRLIGINSSIRTTGTTVGAESGSIGLGFAIPIDEVLPIIDQMKEGETPTHARLGIKVGDVVAPAGTSGAEVVEGARIEEVSEGATAEGAGLAAGDVITRIDDTMITGSDSLVATIRSYRPGDQVRVTYVRDGDEKSATLTLDSDAELDD